MTVLTRTTCLVVLVLFVQAQILLFKVADAMEQRRSEGMNVAMAAGDIRAIAWSGIAAVLVLFVVWVLLKTPLTEPTPMD
jgi:hypothetical protein